MALTNDINLVTNGRSALAKANTVAVPAASYAPSVEDRLRQLANLKEQRLITDEEYNAKRQQLLNEI